MHRALIHQQRRELLSACIEPSNYYYSGLKTTVGNSSWDNLGNWVDFLTLATLMYTVYVTIAHETNVELLLFAIVAIAQALICQAY